MAWGFVTGAIMTANSSSATSPWAAGALGGSVSVSHRVMVCVGYNAAGGTPVVSNVSDGLGNTYRKEASLAFTAGAPQELSLWSAPITTGGTPSFSVTFAGGTGGFGISIAAATYSGLSTASNGTEIDVAAKITSGGAASGTTTGTTSAANELVIGFYTDFGDNTSLTAGTGYIARANDSPNLTAETFIEDKDSGASSGVTVSATLNNGTRTQCATGVIVFGLAGAVVAMPPGLGPVEHMDVYTMSAVAAMMR